MYSIYGLKTKMVFNMIIIFNKILYSILYSVHKSLRSKSMNGKNHMYKSYISNAYQLIGLPFLITIITSLQLLDLKNVSKENIFISSFVAVFLLIILLSVTITKKRMLKYRYAFAKRKKYILIYFLFLISLITLSFLYSLLNVN